MSLEKKPDILMNRRKALFGGATVIATAVIGGAKLLENAQSHEPPKQKYPEQPHDVTPSILEYQAQPKEYDMGELEGMRVSDLLAKYIGIEGKLPKKAMLDFKDNLKRMWEGKFARGGNTKELLDVAKALFDSYDPAHIMRRDLVEYEQRIDDALMAVRSQGLPQITKLPAFSKFNDMQMELFRRFESTINAKMLLAYAATEIMPTKGAHSGAGLAVLEFLLMNAGEEYVARLPALNDKFVSFGPYQFTRNALHESGHEKVGASLINSLLPVSQIPTDVADLRGADHHKAAYLFALHNIALLVKRLGSDDSSLDEKLLAHFDEIPEGTILEFIATAHHLPGNAIDAFEDFAGAFVRYKEPPHRVATDVKHTHTHAHVPPPIFARFCADNELGDYCDKTRSNMIALTKRETNRKQT